MSFIQRFIIGFLSLKPSDMVRV